MLNVNAVESGYGASQVLFGVDLEIGAGQVVTLLGRNGMGKTTLLRTLFGQLPLRAGSVRFAGQEIGGWSPDRIARAGLAIVPEGRQCFPNLTVREHLTAFVAARNPSIGQPWTPQRVFELFPRLGERAGNMGNQLSGGEQQMLAIARAAASKPKFIMLDEPSEGIMPVLVDEMFRYFETLKAAGVTMLLIEQNVELALAIADRAYILDQGEVVYSGGAQAMLADEVMQERYCSV